MADTNQQESYIVAEGKDHVRPGRLDLPFEVAHGGARVVDRGRDLDDTNRGAPIERGRGAAPRKREDLKPRIQHAEGDFRARHLIGETDQHPAPRSRWRADPNVSHPHLHY